MDWYYVAENKSIGPIDDQQFGQLVGSGNIRAETLVWREGMANWLPYRQAVAPSSAFPLPASGPISLQITPVADQVLCLECRRAVPREETIQSGADYICAACKPAFIQQLREGADAPRTMIYSGLCLA